MIGDTISFICINYCILINTWQEKIAKIGDVAEMWLNLKLPDDYVVGSFKFVKTEIHPLYSLNKYALCANYLHHKRGGRKLSGNQFEDVKLFLLAKVEKERLEDLILFKNGSGIFNIVDKNQIDSQQVFWEFAHRKHKNFASLA